jgi:predicted O-methyltransferase YrrM
MIDFGAAMYIEDDFCPSLRALLNAETIVGKTGKVFGRDMLASNSTKNNLITLTRLMMEHRPERTLEVGFAFGASALVFTDGHRKLGHQGQRHVAIDPWESDGWDNIGLENIKREGLLEYLDFRAALSALELPHLLGQGATFDMIYIDGSHDFDDVFVDAYYSGRLLSPGGIMLLDDSPHAPIAKVVRLLRKDRRLTEVDLGRYRTGSSLMIYRIAKLLNRIQLTAFQSVATSK